MKIVKPTQMQHDFCSAYIKNGFNAKQAALTAGYSHSYAHVKAIQLLDKPEIKARVESAYKMAERKLGLDWEWKLKKLKRIITEIIPDDETSPIKLGAVREAIKAIAELNKMAGDYAPEKRLSMTVDATQHKLDEVKKQYKEY